MTAYKAFTPKQCMLCTTPPVPVNVPAFGLSAWLGGALIQNAFPSLTDGERELLKSGIHEECWDAMFGGDDDD